MMFEIRTWRGRLALQVLVTVMALPFVFPLIVMVKGSLAGQGWRNFKAVLQVPGLGRFFVNSAIIAAAVIAVVFAALIRLIRPMKGDALAITIATLSCIAGFALHQTPQFQPELMILFVAAVVCFVWSQRHGRPRPAKPRKQKAPPKPAKTMAIPKGRVRGRR